MPLGVTNIGCLSIASLILFLLFPQTTDCSFFRWVEDVGKTNVSEWEELEGKLLEKETAIAQLEVEKNLLEEKIKKLIMKGNILQQAMQDKRNELCQLHGAMCKYERGEKYAQITFVMSWLIFSIVVMVRN